jgi:large subunit ribosomal protein L21
MIAVVEINKKQYTIEENQIFDIEKIDPETTTLRIESVLLLTDGKTTEIGQPYIKDVTVDLDVLETYKDKKVIIFKFKRKTGYKLTKGHRQRLTTVKVKKITQKSSAKPTTAKEEKETKSSETSKE